MKRSSVLLTIIISSFTAIAQNAYEDNIKKANEGDMVAQHEIGVYFWEGKGGTKDYAKAFFWFTKAANQGYANSQHKLGIMYDNGQGVKKDFKDAIYWYKKAAEQGFPSSQNNLGSYFFSGNGVEKDYVMAVYWFRKAAEQGNAIAQSNLARCYMNGNGVEKDYTQAIYWARKSAEQGEMFGQEDLGYCFLNGYGVEKDLGQAVNWYRKAAEQGSASGQVYLGNCYFNGWGVEQDLYQAEYWIGKAAEQGNTWAIGLIPKVLSQLNEQEENKLLSVNTSKTTSVDFNIPTTDKIANNYFAVIIGNEKYQNEVEVPFAENDAKVFKEYVNHTLGVPDKNIKYITNGTLNGIRIAVKWLAQAMEVCGGENQAIFYYAGHGIPDEASKSAYLLPVDGIGSDPESAYSLDRLYGEFEKMSANRVLVFLDACFSGAKREDGMLASARGVAIKAKPAAPKGNMIVFTAAQGDETAYPFREQRHGMFTYYLLRKLKETNGDVTLGDLADYLQDEVKRQSFVENKKMQTPTVTASQSVANGWKNMNFK